MLSVFKYFVCSDSHEVAYTSVTPVTFDLWQFHASSHSTQIYSSFFNQMNALIPLLGNR